MKNLIKPFLITLSILFFANSYTIKAQQHEVLIITGQNNHYWQGSSKIIEQIFNNSDLFNATVVTSPAKGEDMSAFNPNFKKYDLICLDYNGDYWSEKTQKNFVKLVKFVKVVCFCSKPVCA